MIFCTKLHLDESKKMFQADFRKKSRFQDFSLKWPIFAFFGYFWSLGFSRKAYGFTLVRPSVRPCVRASVTPYLEIRASDFDDFLHKATS